MNGWRIFWECNLIISGAAFAVITVIVAIRGFADLRELFASLTRSRKSHSAE